MCGCILGWNSVPFHNRVTVTSDLVARICIESGAYYPYCFEVGIPNLVYGCIFGWLYTMIRFWVTVTLTSLFRIMVSDQISYIIRARYPKFGVWLHRGMAECHIPNFGSL